MANLLNDDETIIIAGGFENPELCYLLNKSEVPTKIVHLSSNQEEADTRIILHVLAEMNLSNTILVKSVDTDVLLLLIYYYSITLERAKCNMFFCNLDKVKTDIFYL